MLALLLTWASPARSVTFEWDRVDDGGGRYLFESEKISYDGWNTNSVYYFRTQKAFSWDNDQFVYEYDFRAAHPVVSIEYLTLEGTVLLVTADNVAHAVGTWSKTASNSSRVTFSNTDATYGQLFLNQVDDGHTLHLKFVPTPRYGNPETGEYIAPAADADVKRPITPEQFEHRMILRRAMTAHGFKPLDSEWWHFTLKDEPFPDTYFNFPVKQLSNVTQ